MRRLTVGPCFRMSGMQDLGEATEETRRVMPRSPKLDSGCTGIPHMCLHCVCVFEIFRDKKFIKMFHCISQLYPLSYKSVRCG